MNLSVKYSEPLRHRLKSIIAYPAGDLSGGTIIEIGPGRGDFLFHLAKENPNKQIYGIEIKGKRFEKLIRRRENRKLFNIKLILADAAVAIPELFERNQVEAIYINFPDPWPKKRHTKNRLLKSEFLKSCANVLTKNGSLFITTDVERYANEVFEHCQTISELKSVYDGIKTESDEAYPTLFAEKWKREGREIYYQKFLSVGV